MPKEATNEPSSCTAAITGCSVHPASSPPSAMALVTTVTATALRPYAFVVSTSPGSPRTRPTTPVTSSDTRMNEASTVRGKSCRGALRSAWAGVSLGSWSSRLTRRPSSPFL